MSFVSVGRSQNLINTGTITNAGTMKVRNQVTGLPPAIDGVFEYFGANQDVPATQYRNLVLSGSGQKTTTGGGFAVTNNIGITPAVTLKIQTASLITLGGDLTENGYLEGSIRKTINLTGVTTTSDFGGIGATGSWTGTAPGVTIVTRMSGVASTGNGNQSILRYYDISPTVNTGLNGTLVFRYSDNELNGRDPNTLELWRSLDGGLTWRRQGGTVNTTLRTITKTAIVSFSRWTASDASNLLGPATYESVIVGDVNSDQELDIADLTSIIDHMNGRRVLVGTDSVKADVNRDRAINALDVVAMQNDLLGITPLTKTSQPNGPAIVPTAAAGTLNGAGSQLAVTAELELTRLGLRFNLTNTVPVKGIELYIRLNSPVNVDKPDVVFERARQMGYHISSVGQEVRLVAYNLENLPVASGAGAIVRLPIRLADTSFVDSAHVVVSTADTTFDVALRAPVSKRPTNLPTEFRLYQNYPNPFNPNTTIEYEAKEVSGRIPRVAIQIFNILGQKVLTIDRGEKDAGRYRVVWDGRDDTGTRVPSGIYFYRLLTQDFATSKKMVLLK